MKPVNCRIDCSNNCIDCKQQMKIGKLVDARSTCKMIWSSNGTMHLGGFSIGMTHKLSLVGALHQNHRDSWQREYSMLLL